MGMWNRRHLARGAISRGMFLAFGLAGVIWSTATLPLFWLSVSVREVAARIIADERFKPGLLGDVQATVEAEKSALKMHPELERARALLRLRIAEEARQRDGLNEADRKIEGAYDGVQEALSMAPTDSFLWLMLYSIEIARRGFDSKLAAYLNRSYTTGPLEGWIALRRNRLALSAFPFLGSSTQKLVVSEFSEMVDADLTEISANNLVSVGWPYRESLLAGLSDVDISSRQKLAKRMARDGVKIDIPGIKQDDRPW